MQLTVDKILHKNVEILNVSSGNFITLLYVTHKCLRNIRINNEMFEVAGLKIFTNILRA